MGTIMGLGALATPSTSAINIEEPATCSHISGVLGSLRVRDRSGNLVLVRPFLNAHLGSAATQRQFVICRIIIWHLLVAVWLI